MKRLQSTGYIYSIKIANIPIYIGSTANLNKRTKNHNDNLNGGNTKGMKLYPYLRRLGIEEIELNIIKEVPNCYWKLAEGVYISNLLLEEERAINCCIKKGIRLTNTIWPLTISEEGYYRKERKIPWDEYNLPINLLPKKEHIEIEPVRFIEDINKMQFDENSLKLF